MALFDIKDTAPFDAVVFETMLTAAQKALDNVVPQKRTQAIVLRTAKKNQYVSVISDALSDGKAEERELIGKMVSGEDTEVTDILCMWHDGSVDLPSFAFRNMLCQANANNRNAGIFVFTANGYSTLKLVHTLPTLAKK